MLTEQAKSDRRHIPTLWYWKLLRAEDGDPVAPPDDVLDETAAAERRYAAPIPVHLYVDWTPEKKGKKKGRTEKTGTARIAISRAECRRLGELLKTHDDSEGLLGAPAQEDFIFIPRAEDIFRDRRNQYYEVQQLTPEWLGATGIRTVWKGSAAMVRDDITTVSLEDLPAPPSLFAPKVEVVPWPA
jgi:hypothetical protein